MKKVGIIGGSGYAGEELIRFLSFHDKTDLIAVSSRELAGSKVSELIEGSSLVFIDPDDEVFFDCEVIFFATPHGISMRKARHFLNKNIKIIDPFCRF